MARIVFPGPQGHIRRCKWWILQVHYRTEIALACNPSSLPRPDMTGRRRCRFHGISHVEEYLGLLLMNSIYYPLSQKLGVENEPHPSKCPSAINFGVHLTGTLMNLSLCLAWMQTVHIESSFVHHLTRDCVAV